MHVAKNEQLLALAHPVVLTWWPSPAGSTAQSWEYVSQNGTDEDVLQYLRDNNLQRTDLEKIAFRMRDAAFFPAAIELAHQTARLSPHALVVRDRSTMRRPAIREFLQHADEFVAQCGEYLDSPLLTMDPVARKTYQHLDYRPLVNDRAHPLGRRRQIANERFFEQYHRLLKILSYKRELDQDDLMSVTYYLLLQDRVEEALEFFGRGRCRAARDAKLQYDYFAAYLALYQGELPEAREADRSLADSTPWTAGDNAFAAIDQQLKEIAGAATSEWPDPEDRGQTQTQLAASEPSFEFQVEGKKRPRQLSEPDAVRVDYYLMDIELLFSRNPFVQQYCEPVRQHPPESLGRRSSCRRSRNRIEFSLPEDLQNRNVLVADHRRRPDEVAGLLLQCHVAAGDRELRPDPRDPAGNRQTVATGLRQGLRPTLRRRRQVLQGRLHRPARPLRLHIAQHQRTGARGAIRAAGPQRRVRRSSTRGPAPEAVKIASRKKCQSRARDMLDAAQYIFPV